MDAALVAELLREQFPELAPLPLQPVVETGTSNSLYRLGDELCVRLPRTAGSVDSLKRELDCLPRLAPALPMCIPEPVAVGEASPRHPLPWAVYRWLPGAPCQPGQLETSVAAAEGLAKFVEALQAQDPQRAPASRRDRPLALRDAEGEAAIAGLEGEIDAEQAARVWRRTLEAPDWAGDAVWIHGDLLPPNLLLDDAGDNECFSAVIDFGNVGCGDPAVDVIPAWTLFAGDARAAYRLALAVDDGTWLRSAGMALHQALLIIPYYRHTHPGFCAMATRTAREVLAEFR